MEKVVFGRWQISADPEETRRAYECIVTGAPEECGCAYCRNFVAARGHVYSKEVRDLFERLGIRFDRESETYDLGESECGLYLYGGFFHFVGVIESGRDALEDMSLEPVTGRFSVGFTSQVALVPESFRNASVVQLEFLANVPWLIDEPRESLL